MDQDDGHGHHDPSQPGGPADPLEPDHTREDLFGEPLPEELRETLDQNPLGGRTYIYRTGQLLVDASQSRAVRDFLSATFQLRPRPVRLENPEQRAMLERTGLVLLQLDEDQYTVERLVSSLRTQLGQGDTPLRVYPNHALSVASHSSWCPTGPPKEPGKGAPSFDPAPHDDPKNQSQTEEKTQGAGGPTIGVLDTGYSDHPFLDRHRFDRRDEDLDQLPAGGELPRYAGHGSFTVGILLENAPTATVIARNLPPIDSTATMIWVDDTMLAGALLRFMEDFAAIDILVLPIAGPTHDGLGLPCTRGVLDLYRRRRPDLVIVAAAGNDGTETPYYPAAYWDVIGVAALARGRDERAGFSNYGPWVKACAEGEELYSTFVRWKGSLAMESTAAGQGPYHDFPGSAVWSGTSFAAPVAAAAIANRMAGEPGPVATANLLWEAGVQRLPDLGAVVRVPQASKTLAS